MVKNDVWILPRPRIDNLYDGGFPLHFEKKLYALLGTHKTVLHPFGGKAEKGIRIDLLIKVEPDIIADAHNLPIKDESFDIVVLDPPYNAEYCKELYGITHKLKYFTYLSEAIRACKRGGFIVVYHIYLVGRPEGCTYFRRIFIGDRPFKKPRVVTIFQKETLRKIKLTEYITSKE